MIKGNCPMGCGPKLYTTMHHEIRCSYSFCPRPMAVNELLADGEAEHIVWLKEHDFTVLHPLKERLDNALLDCSLVAWLTSLDCAPRPLGKYRVVWRGTSAMAHTFQGTVDWEQLDE